MHPFFASLSDREAVLLATTLTMGGSDHVRILSFLPAEARQRLQEKAQALIKIPADKRVPFMVRELRTAIAARGLRGAERVDPSWIVYRLKGERARVVGAVLIGLPPPMVRSVLRRLPPGIRKRLPRKREVRSIPKAVTQTVRQMFEARFDPMPVKVAGSFSFRDVVHLERLELFALMRDLGLVELGQAFASVGKMALVELCRRLPRSKAEELIQAVRSTSRVDLPDRKSAQRFLSRVVVNFEHTEEFFQKAGLWRIAKGSLLEQEPFVRALRQRLPRGAGALFLQFLEKAREMEELDEGVLRRLQDSVLLRVDELSCRGAIGPQWAQIAKTFHNPEEARNVSLPRNSNEPTAVTKRGEAGSSAPAAGPRGKGKQPAAQ